MASSISLEEMVNERGDAFGNIVAFDFDFFDFHARECCADFFLMLSAVASPISMP